ncbi:hypothetical protein IGI04_040442 [Brassica rapa subsp. trilocularis]|uniref:Uncharacterized protein n=1 Tax=Brassica rapa subsp. trilocularis TaxID=1813537 RepID=A0ABQ7KRZ8_BRACM|nr:hypothetical protein IGI04_040442 [Brassica rapa subsp. trilocularis]
MKGGLQSQVTELHRAQEELEQSAEKLNQLESENLVLRVENQSLNTASNKKRRLQTQIRSMPTLETPNSKGDTTRPPTMLNRDGAAHGKAKGTQPYDVEDTESEPDSDKKVPKGGTTTKSSMTAYLEQMFSKRLDAMQYMVGVLLDK